MLPDTIMQSDLLDILFENRNKTYGAYALRRSYNKTLTAAISATFFVAIVFSVLQFTHHSKQKNHLVPFVISDPTFTKFDDIKPVKPEPLPQHHAAIHFNQIINSTPAIVKDDTKTQMPTIDDLTKNAVGAENIIGKGSIDVIQSPVSTSSETGTSATPAVETKPYDAPLYSAEVMPEYPGGIDALRKFMLKNLREPDDLQAGEKIVVTASFVVNNNGEIEQVKIVNSGRKDLDKEVQRVINKMPLWKPGLQNGHTVSVYFNLPVTFMSADEN